MEKTRPDRFRGYATTFKVGLLLALSFSFTSIAWNYVKEIYYARKDSRVFYAILTLACSLFNIAGAIVADTMARKAIPLRVTAAVGTFLTAPILFLHWWLMGQVAEKTYTETTGEYVIAFLCGMIESLGTGMVLTAAYSYICKQATGLASGRKFGSL